MLKLKKKLVNWKNEQIDSLIIKDEFTLLKPHCSADRRNAIFAFFMFCSSAFVFLLIFNDTHPLAQTLPDFLANISIR